MKLYYCTIDLIRDRTFILCPTHSSHLIVTRIWWRNTAPRLFYWLHFVLLLIMDLYFCYIFIWIKFIIKRYWFIHIKDQQKNNFDVLCFSPHCKLLWSGWSKIKTVNRCSFHTFVLYLQILGARCCVALGLLGWSW